MEARSFARSGAGSLARSRWIRGGTRRTTKGEARGIRPAGQRYLGATKKINGRGPGGAQQKNERRRNSAYRAQAAGTSPRWRRRRGAIPVVARPFVNVG